MLDTETQLCEQIEKVLQTKFDENGLKLKLYRNTTNLDNNCHEKKQNCEKWSWL